MKWLTEFSKDLQDSSEEELLREAIEGLTDEQRINLGYDTSIIDRPSHIDEMEVKIASAISRGKELAHQHGDELEKNAIAQLIGPAIAGIGRLAAGAGASKAVKTMAGTAVKDFAMNKATGAVAGGLQRANQAVQPAAGGFKYANMASSLSGIGSKAMSLAASNPRAAAGIAGAVGGAAFAPTDPQTGEKHYLRGAAVGGGLGVGGYEIYKRMGARAPVQAIENTQQVTKNIPHNTPAPTTAAPVSAPEPSPVTTHTPPPTSAPVEVPAQAPVSPALPNNTPAPAPAQVPAPPQRNPSLWSRLRGRFKKEANVGKALSNFGTKAVGFAAHNPGAAMGVAGAAAGAAFAPRDPQTGQKQYMKGALIGGGLGVGANAISGGAIGNKLHGAVTGDRAILGGRVKNFVNKAQSATPQFAPKPRSITTSEFVNAIEGEAAKRNNVPTTPAPGPSRSVKVDPKLQREAEEARLNMARARNDGVGGGGIANQKGIFGGSTELTVPSNTMVSGGFTTKQAALRKKANMQRLVYNPTTKTFTRNHITPDNSMANSGVGNSSSDVIPAGHSEPVMRMSGPSERPVPANIQSSPRSGTAAAHTLHGGDVISSSPGPGLAARAPGTPPPIPAAARRSFASASSAKLPKNLPSLRGAVSLAKVAFFKAR